MKANISKILVLGVVTLMSHQLFALPTFQAYVDGWAGDLNGDQDTWFTNKSPFDLIVVGAYQGEVTSLTDVTLLVSVPEGKTGTVSIDGNPLLTKYADKSFLPSGTNFNNHYPLQSTVSDFYTYGLGSFDDLYCVHDYDADTGTTDLSGNLGEEKTYSVSVSGYTWAHFDVYGIETKATGSKLKSTWELSANSHDSTYVIPAPGAILLGSLGVVVVGWLRRRGTLLN